MSCTRRQDEQFQELEMTAKAMRPSSLFSQQSCISDVLSHKYFQWHDTTVDVITNKDMAMIKGEIITGSPEFDSKRVNDLSSRGMHEEKAKPCRVNEVHEHEGQHHVHFTCSLPYVDVDDISNLLSDIIKIKRPL